MSKNSNNYSNKRSAEQKSRTFLSSAFGLVSVGFAALGVGADYVGFGGLSNIFYGYAALTTMVSLAVEGASYYESRNQNRPKP